MVLNYKAVVGTLGALLFFLGVALLAPMGVGLIYQESTWWSFGMVALIACGIGGPFWYVWGRTQDEQAVGVREGFAIVALSWLVLSLVGALPFVMSGVLASYTNAFFETMSGFTTTGATILGGVDTPDVENIPKAFLFWRSLTHWLGGMGIIVLTLAILPILGVGGMQLYKAEVPGPSADKMTPRVRETAKRLWFIYVGLTAVQVVLLSPAMSFFDAVNHAFATMATGGFSTLNGSVGDFGSAYVDWVIIVFMYLAGVNFALYYRWLRGQTITVMKDTELRVYTGVVVVATLLIVFGTWQPTLSILRGPESVGVTGFEGYPNFLVALRQAAFQAVTIITTTGFATANYELWPPLAIGIIFLLFFIGGMAGSTAGGVKVVRHVLLVKSTFADIKRLIHPQAIMPVRLNDQVVSPEILRHVLSFVVLYFALIAFGTGIMGLLGLDLLSSFGATISCIANTGPAFGSLGPVENYAHVPLVGKWVLAFLMMAGRLEIFTVLILFVPAFWQR